MERGKVHLIDMMLASNKNEGEWKFYILQEFINRGWINKSKKGEKKRFPPEKVRSVAANSDIMLVSILAAM